MAKYTYYCYKTNEKIKIDGKLDEKIWAKTRSVGKFQYPWADKNYIKQSTSAKLLWDDKYLYLGYFANDYDITAKNRGRCGKVYEDDVVELFLDPTPKDTVFFGFEINALGNLLDFKERFFRKKMKVNLGKTIKAAVYKKKGRYFSAELAIPFKALNKKPKHGSIWKMALSRIDYNKGRNPEYSMWKSAGTKKPDYHRIKAFGKLIFRKR